MLDFDPWVWPQLWPQGLHLSKSENTTLGHHVCTILKLWFLWLKCEKIFKAQNAFRAMLNFDPWEWPQLWPQGFHLNKSEYTTLGHHVCTILKLWLLQFYRRRFSKLKMHFGLCWTLTPGCGPIYDPRDFIFSKSESTPLGHHVCTILKLWLLQFYGRRFSKLKMYFGLCWTLTPGCGPNYDPRDFILANLNLHP